MDASVSLELALLGTRFSAASLLLAPLIPASIWRWCVTVG
ncbi:MAG: hypothetical protein J07HX5_02002 [halophilic archaeon J07HX5]|nr:MAG: hypothetical protein J07HX5_02002 [halophilic archaeon J07HX5]